MKNPEEVARWGDPTDTNGDFRWPPTGNPCRRQVFRALPDSNRVGRRDSPPSLLLDAVRAGQIEAVACEELLAEVRNRLGSRYFQDRVSVEEGTTFLEMLRAFAVVLPDPVDPAPVLRDRADDYLVALANAAGAEAIVTSDRDLHDHEGLEPSAVSARRAASGSA